MRFEGRGRDVLFADVDDLDVPAEAGLLVVEGCWW